MNQFFQLFAIGLLCFGASQVSGDVHLSTSLPIKCSDPAVGGQKWPSTSVELVVGDSNQFVLTHISTPKEGDPVKSVFDIEAINESRLEVFTYSKEKKEYGKLKTDFGYLILGAGREEKKKRVSFSYTQGYAKYTNANLEFSSAEAPFEKSEKVPLWCNPKK